MTDQSNVPSFDDAIRAAVQKEMALINPTHRDPKQVMVQGQLVTINKLIRREPTKDRQPCGEGMSHKEFVAAFFDVHKVKLAFMGAARSADNGRELTEMCIERGVTPGKGQQTRWDNNVGFDTITWVNLYPYEVLCDWVLEKSDGKYEMPPVYKRAERKSAA